MCVLFVQRHPAASGNSQSPLCSFMETSVLYDQVSQASFIKLSNASLLFDKKFFLFFLFFELRLGRHETFHILRKRKGREKDVGV